MGEKDKPTTTTASKQSGPQFIPKLRGKKVIIRLVSGGQPITGTVEGYNASVDFECFSCLGNAYSTVHL